LSAEEEFIRKVTDLQFGFGNNKEMFIELDNILYIDLKPIYVVLFESTLR